MIPWRRDADSDYFKCHHDVVDDFNAYKDYDGWGYEGNGHNQVRKITAMILWLTEIRLQSDGPKEC